MRKVSENVVRIGLRDVYQVSNCLLKFKLSMAYYIVPLKAEHSHIHNDQGIMSMAWSTFRF